MQHEVSSLRSLVSQLRKDMNEGKRNQGHDSKNLVDLKKEMLDGAKARRNDKELSDRLSKELHEKVKRQKDRVQQEFNSVIEKGNVSEERRVDLENRVKNLDANLQGGLVTIAVAELDTKAVVDKTSVMGLDMEAMEVRLTDVTRELEASKTKIELLESAMKDKTEAREFRLALLEEVTKLCSEDELNQEWILLKTRMNWIKSFWGAM
jgi:chromosome segregation ATPase